ncbi:ABC transporter substrate-binding protein [Desertimonas flava]|uniref:ABC transporter substrate-binding protein n=1 Tax=Desertimonas flava TaxID=2064846 RepID=UPI000E34E013|nr:ABC transporter substrate-binding protein [Desertimonas flava]
MKMRRLSASVAARIAAVLVVGLGAAAWTGSAAANVRTPNSDEPIVVGIGEDATSLDPAAVEAGSISAAVVFHVYDRLIEVGPSGPELLPALATEVPTVENGGVSEDGLTYTFNLRDDAKFHDGSDVTADDVVYSWERVMTMNLPGSMAETFQGIDEVSALDDRTVQVTLKERDGTFLYNVVLTEAASIVNADVVEVNGGVAADTPNEYMAQNEAGSGPYSLASWERGERLTFDINEEYWGSVATNPTRWEISTDLSVTQLGLRSGDYDIITASPATAEALRGTEGVVIEDDVPGLTISLIGFNLDIPLDDLPDGDDIPADFFHDKRVRQAFNYSFDYDAFREGQLGGAAMRPSFIIPQSLFGYDPDAPIYDYDPAEAERLFRETGWWDKGFTLSIIAEAGNSFEVQALLLKDGIEALNPNFHINVLALPEARFDELATAQPIQAAMWSWAMPDFTDPDGYFRDSVHPTDTRLPSNLGAGYSDPEDIAAKIEAARVEPDSEVRAELYAELQRIMYDEAPAILTAQWNNIVIYRESLQNVVSNPMWPRLNLRINLYSKS